MTIFGMTIGEFATVIGLLTTFASGLLFIFKAIIISPLSNSIDRLNDTIKGLQDDLIESKRDRQVIHDQLDGLQSEFKVMRAAYEERFKNIFKAINKEKEVK